MTTSSSTETTDTRTPLEVARDLAEEHWFRIQGLEEELADKRKEVKRLERQLSRYESGGVKTGLAEEIFDFWKNLNQKLSTTKFSPDRRRAINAALKLHGEANVRKVIAQNAKTPYLVYTAWRTTGNRDSLRDIVDILGKGKHFDALLELSNATPAINWTEERLVEAQTLLLSTEAVLARLQEGKGWTSQTLSDLAVGLSGGRVIFPVRDAQKGLEGVVKYHPRFRDADKNVPKSIADGKRGMFPAPESVDSDVVWLVEGEADAVTAHEMWLPGVGLPGASVTPGDWMERLKGRRVVICLDCDDAGRKCANRIARPLTQFATEVKIVDLDPTRTDGFDLTDWFRQGRQRKTLEEMARMAKPVSRVQTPSLLPQQTLPASPDTRFDRFVYALEAKDCQPKESRGGQWTALCPSHDDRVPTLHFSRGRSCPVVADCKAGCTWDQISESLGHPTRGKE